MSVISELEKPFNQIREGKEFPVPDPNTLLPDSEIIQRVQEGESESFSELYERYQEKIHRHLYYRIGNRSDAEDLTAQTFLRAWDAMPRYREMGRPFGVWLLSISHNLLIDHYRKRRESVNLDDVVIPAGEEVDPEVQAGRHIENEVLAKALIDLKNNNHRAAVVMRYIDGMKPREIAQVMDTTAGNVRLMVYRGLLELRETMALNSGF